MRITRLIPLAVATLGVLAVALPNAAAAAVSADSVANVRDATAGFNDPAVALAGGYDLLTDASDVACIDQPGQGAMRIHYVKAALVQAGTIDAARPQALVYERTGEGRLQFAAVEYVVLQEAWDSSRDAPPTHVWVWMDNPGGMFSMYNSAATCDGSWS